MSKPTKQPEQDKKPQELESNHDARELTFEELMKALADGARIIPYGTSEYKEALRRRAEAAKK